MAFDKTFKILTLSIFCLFLSGCLNFGALSQQQVRALKNQGFVLTNEGWSLGLSERLLFDFDATDVKNINESDLSRLIQQLKKYQLNKVKVIGHADNIGPDDYNLKLSEERAQTVAAIFLSHGFSAENVLVIGRGSSQPIDSNDTEAHRAANRRVSIIIVP